MIVKCIIGLTFTVNGPVGRRTISPLHLVPCRFSRPQLTCTKSHLPPWAIFNSGVMTIRDSTIHNSIETLPDNNTQENRAITR